MFLTRTAALGCAAFTFAAGSAVAQQNAAGETVLHLDPIVVTANKRDQDLEKVDGAVSARTAAELESAGVKTVADLEKVFPGLVVRTRGNRAYANFTVRGLSSPDYYNPTVQVYVDGVPQDRAAFTQELVDIERVEFLRGPQGTLYGRNAFGGVINIITKARRENHAAASTTVTTHTAEAEAAATAVLVPDSTFLDLAVRGKYDRGRIDDIANGKDDIDHSGLINGRAKVRYAPQGGDFDATFSLSHERLDSREEIYVREPLLDKRQYDSALQGPYPSLQRDVTSASLNWNYRFGDFTLTSVTGLQYVSLDRETQGLFYPETNRTLSEELRLSYQGPDRLSYVVGLYAQDDAFTREAEAFPGLTGDSENEVGTQSLALFGEATYKLTDRLDVTAGARVSYDRSSIDFNQEAGGFIPAFGFDDSISFVGFQPKLSLGYQIDDNTRVYGLVSRGYKPGGFNRTVSSPQDAEPYDPETATNFEVGARSSFLDGRLNLSASAYYITSDDKQIYVGMLPFQVIRNAGSATSMGVELEAAWQATDRLTLTGSGTFGRSEFEDLVDPVTGVDYSGNRVPFAPDVTAHLSARYVLDPSWYGGELAVEGAAHYFSRTYFDEANKLTQPAFLTFDAAIEWKMEKGPTLRLFAENLTDEIYRTSSFEFAPGDVRSTVGEGRLIGLSIKSEF